MPIAEIIGLVGIVLLAVVIVGLTFGEDEDDYY